jgi:hypothetical protein
MDAVVAVSADHEGLASFARHDSGPCGGWFDVIECGEAPDLVNFHVVRRLA